MKTFGPYSPCATVGQLVFTAGQVGTKDGMASTDIENQVKQALQNLSDVLADVGSSLSQVIKVTVFLTDMKYFDTMNKVYAEIFAKAQCKPARSTVAVKELPRVANTSLLVEIEAIATRGDVK